MEWFVIAVLAYVVWRVFLRGKKPKKQSAVSAVNEPTNGDDFVFTTQAELRELMREHRENRKKLQKLANRGETAEPTTALLGELEAGLGEARDMESQLEALELSIYIRSDAASERFAEEVAGFSDLVGELEDAENRVRDELEFVVAEAEEDLQHQRNIGRYTVSAPWRELKPMETVWRYMPDKKPRALRNARPDNMHAFLGIILDEPQKLCGLTGEVRSGVLLVSGWHGTKDNRWLLGHAPEVVQADFSALEDPNVPIWVEFVSGYADPHDLEVRAIFHVPAKRDSYWKTT